jgi:NAD(P)-dependent dehydrogenase (short-subunit alcohol dehydrogenase family)
VSKRAIVTGSDSGIGQAAAVALAGAGFDVGITWRTDRAGAEATAAAVHAQGRTAQIAQLDLEDLAGVRQLISELADTLGGLDALVNSAAVNPRAAAIEETLESWQRTLAVNLTGPLLCSQVAARRMINQHTGGRIVNITSIHEHEPLGNGASYASAKAGLGMLTRVMALELAPHAITANAIAPGHIATPMTGYADPDPQPELRSAIPIGRTGTAEEVGAVVAFLCSPAAAYITGASLLVDGGLSLTATVPLQAELERP